MGDGTFTFGIDSDPIAPGEFGAPVSYADALARAGRGVPSVDETPYEDEWGRFYSAYSPVFDSSAKVAGVVTVDFEAAWYEGQLNQNAKTIVLACVLFLGVGTALVLFLTRHYGRRMETITRSLNDLADDMSELVGESAREQTEPPPGDLWGTGMEALEERITPLRDDLREHVTHTETQANSVITSMAADYRAVYHVITPAIIYPQTTADSVLPE